MGTSNAYPGPVGANPLLPPWAPPLDIPDEELPESTDGDAEQEQDGRGEPEEALPPTQNPWRTPKDAMTRYARDGGRGPNAQRSLRRAARGFVRGQGGARGATRASTAGRTTARNLGGFLSTAAASGVDAAAREFGLAYVGQDVDAFFVALVDAIAPAGAMVEEAVARDAAAETVAQLFEQYAVRENGLEVLNALTPQAIGEALGLYVATYINTRLMDVLASRIEKAAGSHLQAYRMEREVKEYIVERVKLEFDTSSALTFSLQDERGRQIVEGIFREGYELLETWQ